jgi:alpha-L-rhamnosidase
MVLPLRSRGALALVAVAALLGSSTPAPWCAAANAPTLAPARLRCEYLVNPLGIDVPRPRLSWELVSDRRADRQTAYQLLAAGSEAALAADRGDLWDTGRVASDQSLHLVYAGRSVSSGERVHWKVRVWDASGRPSAWSAPAWWEMGLLAAEDWQAQWVGTPGPAGTGSAPLFRRTFSVTRRVRAARASICGLGYYELYLNGEKVGDHVLDPAFTRYDRRALYVTHDVTGQLRPGRNAVGVMLGNGWFNSYLEDAWGFAKAPWRASPRFILRIRVDYADGTSETVVSDDAWMTAPGPVVRDAVRGGESYDARRERDHWAEPDGDESGWVPATVVEPPAGVLRAQSLPPIRVVETLTPVQRSEPQPGVFVFDMGRNLAGWARLAVSGPAGASVTMRYGERLGADGTVDQTGIAGYVHGAGFQTDVYVLKGSGTETWEPRFSYHGFQYVEVRGYPGEPAPDAVLGRVVRTAFEPAGSFECSNDLLNAIQRCTLRTYAANFHGYPTDCPQREKNGWTGDGHLAAEQAMLNVDNFAAYTKWMDDFRDEQRESGELPGIVPTSGWGYRRGNGPAWDSAYLLVPWYLYVYAGDTRLFAEHLDRWIRYVDYLTSRADAGILSFGLGDWAPANAETPVEITSTAYYFRAARIVAEAARVVGRTRDAERYAGLAERIRRSFRERFVNATTGQVGAGTQTALACALYQGLLEPAEERAVLERLVAAVRARRGHLDCGVLGTRFLLRALTDHGRADVAYTVATQRDFPSWGWWIAQGASTLWEDWKGEGSRNHVYFADISGWLYEALAGIRADPAAPGFKHLVIRPHVVGDLTWVKAETRSVRGTVASRWQREGDALTLEVSIPPSCTATVFLPGNDKRRVTEGGLPAAQAEGVSFVRREAGWLAYEVGSGRYSFRVERAF